MYKDAFGYPIGIGDYITYIVSDQVSPLRIGKILDIEDLKADKRGYEVAIRLSATDVYCWRKEREVKKTTIKQLRNVVLIREVPEEFKNIL